MKDYFRLLNQYKNKLTRQQYKTFKGQILSGDTKGFIKGLQKLLLQFLFPQLFQVLQVLL